MHALQHTLKHKYTHTELKCSLAECGAVMRGLAEASQRLWLNLAQSWSTNPPLNVSAALSSDSSLWTLHCNKSCSVPPFHPVRRHHSQFNTHWHTDGGTGEKLERASVCVCEFASTPYPILSDDAFLSSQSAIIFSSSFYYHEWKVEKVGWMNNDLIVL